MRETVDSRLSGLEDRLDARAAVLEERMELIIDERFEALSRKLDIVIRKTSQR